MRKYYKKKIEKQLEDTADAAQQAMRMLGWENLGFEDIRRILLDYFHSLDIKANKLYTSTLYDSSLSKEVLEEFPSILLTSNEKDVSTSAVSDFPFISLTSSGKPVQTGSENDLIEDIVTPNGNFVKKFLPVPVGVSRQSQTILQTAENQCPLSAEPRAAIRALIGEARAQAAGSHRR